MEKKCKQCMSAEQVCWQQGMDLYVLRLSIIIGLVIMADENGHTRPFMKGDKDIAGILMSKDRNEYSYRYVILNRDSCEEQRLYARELIAIADKKTVR